MDWQSLTSEFSFEGFLRSTLAVFVVSNVIPVLPVVYEFTSDLPKAKRQTFAINAHLGATLLAILFTFVAPFLFDVLSLNVNDLRIAGGIVLIAFAAHDILFSRARRSLRQITEDPSHGSLIAPLGIPIMIGPGVLCTLLVLSEVHGVLIVVIALLISTLFNVLCLMGGEKLLSFIGEGASKALGKVMSLVLATLGAGMLRVGLHSIFGG